MADQAQPLPTSAAPSPASPQQRSWFSRNWGWALGCGCLSVLLGGVAIVFLLVTFVFSVIKNTDIYKITLQQVQNSPAAREKLGTPIEAGFMPSGNISVVNDSGSANLAIPVSGPKGSGTAKVRATRRGGKWTITSLVLEVSGQSPVAIVTGAAVPAEDPALPEAPKDDR